MPSTRSQKPNTYSRAWARGRQKTVLALKLSDPTGPAADGARDLTAPSLTNLDGVPVQASDRDPLAAVYHLLSAVMMMFAERLQVLRVVEQLQVTLMDLLVVHDCRLSYVLGDQAELA